MLIVLGVEVFHDRVSARRKEWRGGDDGGGDNGGGDNGGGDNGGGDKDDI